MVMRPVTTETELAIRGLLKSLDSRGPTRCDKITLNATDKDFDGRDSRIIILEACLDPSDPICEGSK